MGNRLLRQRAVQNGPPDPEGNSSAKPLEQEYNNHYFTSCCACLDKAFIILLCQILLSVFLLALLFTMLVLIGEKPNSTDFYVGIISIITGYWLGGTLTGFIIGK